MMTFLIMIVIFKPRKLSVQKKIRQQLSNWRLYQLLWVSRPTPGKGGHRWPPCSQDCGARMKLCQSPRMGSSTAVTADLTATPPHAHTTPLPSQPAAHHAAAWWVHVLEMENPRTPLLTFITNVPPKEENLTSPDFLLFHRSQNSGCLHEDA